MQTQIIINQIIILGILVLIGAIGSWIKFITKEVRDSISKLVFYFTLPALIITTFSTMNLTKEIMVNGIWIIVFTNIAILLFYFFGKFSSLLFKLKNQKASVHTVHTMFGNIVYLGFPLIAALYPQKESMLFAALYYFVSTYILWSIGIIIITNRKDAKLSDLLKNLFNPNTLAFAIGIFMMLTNVRFPIIVNDALSLLGKVTSPISMIYIGSMLAHTNIRGLMKRFDLIGLSINKLLLIPIIMLFIIKLFGMFFTIELSQMAKSIIILQCATPCMTLVVIIIKQYGSDDEMAAENVFVTTILSLFTLPLMFWLSYIW